jgi:hypothetical protein
MGMNNKPIYEVKFHRFTDGARTTDSYVYFQLIEIEKVLALIDALLGVKDCITVTVYKLPNSESL